MQRFHLPLPRILVPAAKRMYRRSSVLWTRFPNLFGPLVAKRDPRTAVLLGLHAGLDEVRFVQIGSNDADVGDPLTPFLGTGSWTGCMIEPVKYIFDRLVANHGHNPRLIFENVAVSNQSGAQDFYWLEPGREGLPEWYDQLGSFSLDTILKHQSDIPDLESMVRCSPVETATFDEICNRNNIAELGLLHIDTEGFDYEIIKTIDFSVHKPIVVIYEYKHLSRTDRGEAITLFSDAGYVLGDAGGDMVCVLQTEMQTNRALRRAWEWAALPEVA